MRLSISAALVSFFLSTSVSAAPCTNSVTVQLANAKPGTNADITIPADGIKRPIEDLWGHTEIAQNGRVFATSAQLTKFRPNTVCTISNEQGLTWTLNARHDWKQLGRTSVDLCAAFLTCEDTRVWL
ncbi:hypothetical protein N7474_007969 [Penicillium riverlandense]|uniref:uncharacterized protein n=1 Tax=Penicillium riverlandense TaxID=1903569 RepID=UPI0025491136|nr:uncharacterized protein N7474_007969 [Penicillium riverlandense]KAJ5811668.1 hypothetical protein N7474_007969 [Penicillium riverlandense]